MLDIVTFKWGNKFRAEHVNILFDSVRRYYPGPFRFSAITDDPTGILPAIRHIPLWNDHEGLMSPHGPRHPCCYRRLKLFSRDAEQLIGKRIVCMDLDVIVCGSLEKIWNRPEDMVFYEGQWGHGNTKHIQPYCGSMFMLTAGARPQVWEQFDPERSPTETYDAGFRGSDQGWYGFILGKNEATWGESDGVFCWRNRFKFRRDKRLPADAKLVFFNGKVKPWDLEVQNISWARKLYKRAEDEKAD